ncbi:MAG TPA: alpha/beta hydrolase, partial [Caldithrix sp.]|nr:alpha/beta hydrolase [Caldithrix sp.]
MKKILKITGTLLLGLLTALILLSLTLFFMTKGDYSVPNTVENDPSIPHIEIDNVVFHAESFGNDTN